MSIFSKLFGNETPPDCAKPASEEPTAETSEVFKTCQQKLLEEDFNGAVALLTPIMNDPKVASDARAKAYIMRGKARANLRDLDGGIADLTQAISIARKADLKAEALCLRARCKSIAKNGDWRVTMEDLSEAIGLPGVGVERRTFALVERGIARHYTGDFKGACADHTAVIDLPAAPVEQRARALLARAESKIELFDEDGELRDYNTVLQKMTGVPAAERARALYRRGYFYQWVTRDNKAAVADYEAVLATPGVSDELREAATNSIKSTGRDYSKESKIVDEMRAALKAARKDRE